MAEAGHNSNLTDRERRALRLDYIQKRLALEHRMSALRDEKKKLNGLAKSDGFKIAQIDAGVRLMEMEDQSIFVEEIKDLIGIAQDLGAIPDDSTQFDLFSDKRKMVDRAFDEGQVAGMLAKDRNNPPYGVDSDAGQAWLKGYDEGQKKNAADLQSAMEKRNAEKAEDEVPDDDETEHIENDDSNVVPMTASNDEWDEAGKKGAAKGSKKKTPPKPDDKTVH